MRSRQEDPKPRMTEPADGKEVLWPLPHQAETRLLQSCSDSWLRCSHVKIGFISLNQLQDFNSCCYPENLQIYIFYFQPLSQDTRDSKPKGIVPISVSILLNFLENFSSAHCLCATNCSKHLRATHPMRQDNDYISKMKKLRCRKVKGTQLGSAELEFKPRSLCSYPLGYNPQGFRPKSLCQAQLHQSLSSQLALGSTQ